MNPSKFGIFLILLTTFISCSKNNDIFKNYNCQTESTSTKPVLDAFLKFSLDIPINWKTALYIDQGTSIFATADTTKQLSETFLIKTSSVPGQLILNQNTINKVKSQLTNNQWHIKRVETGIFKNAKALLITSQKQPSNPNVTALNLYFSFESEHYFEIEIQCFGNKNITERFCQAIEVINSLKIKE